MTLEIWIEPAKYESEYGNGLSEYCQKYGPEYHQDSGSDVIKSMAPEYDQDTGQKMNKRLCRNKITWGHVRLPCLQSEYDQNVICRSEGHPHVIFSPWAH